MRVSDRQRCSELGATGIDLLAADWLQRRHFWNWTEVDQAALDAWLNASDKHRIAYLRQSAVWNSAERLVILRPLRQGEATARSRVWPFLTRAAAVLVVAAALGAGSASYLYFFRPHEATYATPIGGHETLRLGDGSQIELNTDSIIQLSKSGNTRQAKLVQGEAYFHIRHDAASPFIVSAGDYRVTDLGTKFVVRRMPARIEVGLLEGRARFDAASIEGVPQSALLTPGDVVVADANSMSMSKKPLAKLMTALSWRQGFLTFKDTMLQDAAAEFNRYNREKLVLAGADVAQLKINGMFKAEKIELFAQSVHDLFGLRVEKAGNEIVISR
jgi:transmembrane sensor